MEDAMRRYPIAVTVCCLSLFVGGAVLGATEQQQGATDTEAAQISALQKERIATLQQLVTICVAQYQSGMLPFDSVAAAQEELLAAQLESTDKPEERVALLKEHLNIVESLCNSADKMFKGGRVSRPDVLRAKSRYLDVKIKLLRESSRLKALTKRKTAAGVM
jgi:hypothetical protein